MRDADYFRQLAVRCTTLAEAAIVPEIKDQLRLWAAEFADIADEGARHSPSTPEVTLSAWSSVVAHCDLASASEQ